MVEPAGLGRARQELGASRLLADGGFNPQAVSRACFATFYAAETALAEVGETRSKHSGVVAAFVQRCVRDEGANTQAGRLLRSLFDRRAQADYGVTTVPPEEAERAVRDATFVVDAIAAWLKERD